LHPWTVVTSFRTRPTLAFAQHTHTSRHSARVSALLTLATALPNHHQSQLRDLGEAFV
jgi:hypothetical protein